MLKVRPHWLLLVAIPTFAYVMAALHFAEDGVVTASGLARGAVLSLALLAATALHELARGIVAWRYGVRAREVVLLPLGGLAAPEPAPGSGRAEMAGAASGALANLAAGALLLGLGPATELARGAAVISLAVGAAHLLPAFPMDGWRVLRALLARRYAPLLAARVAARVGRGAMLVLGLVGVATLPFGAWLILVALFAYAAGAEESAAVETSHVLVGLLVRDVMTSQPVTLRADGTVADALRTMRATKHVSFPVVEEGGGLVGVVGLDDIARVPRAERSAPLRSVVRELVTTASPEEPAAVALGRMIETRQDHVVVMDEGHLAGFVTRSDFSRLVQMALVLEGGARRALLA